MTKAAVVARLSAALRTGDLAPLTTAEAEADAIVLVRAAAPQPGQDLDGAALAIVCRTFVLRARAGGANASESLGVAVALVGILPPDVDVGMPAGDRAKIASLPQAWRVGVFAQLAAQAHGRLVAGPGGAGNLEDDAAVRLAALGAALAWSGLTCAMLSQADDLIQLAESLAHRIGLLTLRAKLAGDPDAWGEAAVMGDALTGLLSPGQAAHGPYLAAAAEAIARAALILGEPSVAEAERAAALAPAGHQTKATADLLRMLGLMHAEPVSWPGELAARAGAGLLTQGQAGAHPGLLAAASRRFHAALALTPADHPARPRLAIEARNTAVAYAVAGGAGLPVDAVLAAFVMDLHRLAKAAGSQHFGSTITDAWLAGYESAFGGLPPAHPDWRDYAVILAAGRGLRADLIRAADPERAAQLTDRARQILDGLALPPQCAGMLTMKEGTFAQSLSFAAYLTPWSALATALTALGPRPTGAEGPPAMAGDRPTLARDLAEAFGALDQGFGGSDGLPGAFRDLFFMDLDPAADGQREQTQRRLAALAEQIPADRPARRATLIAMLGTNLSTVASLRQDPAIGSEAADLILRAMEIDPAIQRNPGVATAFAVALTLDPGRVLQRWDDRQRLAATALLASVEVTERGGGFIQLALAKAVGEILVAAMTLAAQNELSQLQRIHDLADRARDLARQAGPEATERYIPVLDMLVAMMNASADMAAALPEFRAAQVQAAAVEGFRQRLAAMPTDHPVRPMLEVLVGVQLTAQAGLTRDDSAAADLRAEAESLYSRALAAMPTQQAALIGGYLRPDSPLRSDKSKEAIRAAFSQAVDNPEGFQTLISDPRLPVRDRVHEGLNAAIQAMTKSQIVPSLYYAELSVELMSQVTDRGSDHESAEHALAGLMPAHTEQYMSGLLAMLRMFREQAAERSPELLPELAATEELVVAKAAALAERARGVLLARQFESRTDLSELEAAHPGLADEYERLVTALGADPDTLAELRPGSDPPAIGRAEWARLDKLRLSREMDALIRRIRDVPGFGGFQRGLEAVQLRALAARGPVVLLTYPGWPGMTPNDAYGRPCAFIVTAESIAAFRLDDDFVAFDAAAAKWRAAIADITARGARRPGVARLRQARQDLTEVLSWTWHHVTGPVLDAAGLGAGGPRTDGPRAGGWPRVWWIPDGPLNALPLHAAECHVPGCQLGGCGSALDLVVSSYVPSFRTLAHARGRAVHRPVTVSDPGAVSGPAPVTGPVVIVAANDDDLPGAEAAAWEAADRLGVDAGEILVGDTATRERVLAGLGRATWAHFGCHATSDPRQPSSGTLHLPSGETLTVREIFAGSAGRGLASETRLAFLTACGTARTSERLASEAIHLTSAFLVAGFTEAIGTLWEIDSISAREVTVAFYERVTGPSPEPPAVALHHCAQEVRREHPGDPYTWAAYIHSGA